MLESFIGAVETSLKVSPTQNFSWNLGKCLRTSVFYNTCQGLVLRCINEIAKIIDLAFQSSMRQHSISVRTILTKLIYFAMKLKLPLRKSDPKTI